VFSPKNVPVGAAVDTVNNLEGLETPKGKISEHLCPNRIFTPNETPEKDGQNVSADYQFVI
jgi:hypothetical protein